MITPDRLNKLNLLLAWAMICQPAIGLANANQPLKQRSVDEILNSYTFIADFRVQPETRDNSSEIFWRYPIAIPRIDFALNLIPFTDKQQIRRDFPATEGGGREYQHLNHGRALFLKKEFEKARQVWLGGRARYGTSYDYHRRNDYFIANAFLYEGYQAQKNHNGDYKHQDVRHFYVNANTFLSWAFNVKANEPDPLLERIAPRAYYNQATLYYMFDKWPAAYAAVNRGLDFLRRTGRSEFRMDMHRMMAELYIRNRSYLEAIQQLDLALRQHQDVDLAAHVFARAGDIYFDLNNFELAEDAYALAIRLDRERHYVRPEQYILRGESLFWLGRFSESQKMMAYGLKAMARLDAPGMGMPIDFQALASIRIADSYLALGQIDKAKLEYFRHRSEFRNHLTSFSAELRQACLELPFYQGNNILHTRQLLAELKDRVDVLPGEAQQLAWTCEVASYAQHERTKEMVDRVREYAQVYPRSEFLRSVVEPVREVQSEEIQSYFASGDLHGAITFFEKTRSFLYPKVSPELARQLFRAYVDTSSSEKAKEFYYPLTEGATETELLRHAAMLSEVTPDANSQPWHKRLISLVERLSRKEWSIGPTPETRFYIDRILDSNLAAAHYPWIATLGISWTESNFAASCDLVYPILQKLTRSPDEKVRKLYTERTKSFISFILSDVLRYETYCAYSMMELELGLYENDAEALVATYDQRDFLPVNSVTAGLFYTVAERAWSAGLRDDAREIWQLIVKKGDPNLAEVRFARSRLDPRRTELEKLWQ